MRVSALWLVIKRFRARLPVRHITGKANELFWLVSPASQDPSPLRDETRYRSLRLNQGLSGSLTMLFLHLKTTGEYLIHQSLVSYPTLLPRV